jgi:hypothetical protein
MDASKTLAVVTSFMLAAWLTSTTPAWGAAAIGLRVGAAKIDITPTDLAGLTNVWGRQFEGVHDPLFARVLVLDNVAATAAVVTADLSAFGNTWTLREQIARELAIPIDHIFIMATHDHSAPRAGPVTPGARTRVGGPATAAYTEKVYEKVVTALQQAKASLRPARMGAGSGRADVNINRDEYTGKGWTIGIDADGPSDKTVWVVKFESLSGEPIAILMNYAVHSVVLGPDNTLVNGDLAGAAQRHVEHAYQDKVVALWTMGAAGDQNPIYNMSSDDRPPGDQATAFQAMDAQGQIVGAEVVRVANRIRKMNSAVNIKAAERVIACPIRPPTEPQPAGMNQVPATSLDIRLGLLQLDQIALTAVSGEVVTNIYWRLKRASPLTNTIMMTMINDRIGYIVDDAAYDRPIFEVSASPLARGCAESGVVNGLLEMIEAAR